MATGVESTKKMPSWFGRKTNKDEDGGANPSWLDAQNDGGVGEETPLIDSDGNGGDDDEKEVFDEESCEGGIDTVASPNEGSCASSWHDKEVPPSAATASSRSGVGSMSKKMSTRSRMNEYKAKLESRRRRMLSGLPRRNCCHVIFIFLNVAAVVACLFMILSEIIPLFFVEQTLLKLILRCYLTFFCLIFIIAELELSLPFIRSSQSLHNFVSKGFNFTFVAIVGLEQAQADLVEETVKKRSVDPMGVEWGWFNALFVEIPAWIMLGVGLLYIVMGIFCMRPLRDRCREDYAARMELYFEAREEGKSKKLGRVIENE